MKFVQLYSLALSNEILHTPPTRMSSPKNEIAPPSPPNVKRQRNIHSATQEEQVTHDETQEEPVICDETQEEPVTHDKTQEESYDEPQEELATQKIPRTPSPIRMPSPRTPENECAPPSPPNIKRRRNQPQIHYKRRRFMSVDV